VRYFVMGVNEWRDAEAWPPPGSRREALYLIPSGDGRTGLLRTNPSTLQESWSSLQADPQRPVIDPHDTPGAHDYRALGDRRDVLTFESEPFAMEATVVGDAKAIIRASCDCRDFDLWVRLLDVHPDGRAYNLMGPGNDAVRASYRVPAAGRQPLEPGRIYELEVSPLMTGIRLGRGHRLRAQVSASFDPHLSRNLQTGKSETDSSGSRVAEIRIHHSADHASRLLLPLVR
jgi:hypothetical protein